MFAILLSVLTVAQKRALKHPAKAKADEERVGDDVDGKTDKVMQWGGSLCSGVVIKNNMAA